MIRITTTSVPVDDQDKALDVDTVAVLDHDPRLHDLRGAGQCQDHRPRRVDDLELVREVLVERRHEAQQLLRCALSHLAHGADSMAVLVEHRVLVAELDQLGLLVDHENRLGQKRGHVGHRAKVAGHETSARRDR